MATKGIRAGRAFVELFADDSKLARGLKAAQRRLQAFAGSVKAMGSKLLALGGLAAGPIALTIKAAGDLQETMAKFGVVFGDNAGAVQAWGDELANQVGRSKKQVADFLAGSQDLLVPLGIDEGQATAMSKTLARLAIDLASFNNIADEDAMRDLQAALTGSSETMKKYGVVVNQAAVNQALLDQGLDPKNATEAQKAVARLNLILEGTTAAQGDAVRSAGSFTNQMKALKARVMDAAATFGSQLLPIITPLVQNVVKAVTATGQWIEANPQLARTILAVTAGVAGAGVALLALGAAGSAVATVVGLVTTGITTLAAVVGAVLSPLGLVAAALTAGAAAWLNWSESGQAAMQRIGGIVAGVGDFIGKVFAGIKASLMAGDFQKAGQIAMAGLQVAWQAGVNALQSTWRGFQGWFASVLDALQITWAAFVDQLEERAKQLGLYEHSTLKRGKLKYTPELQQFLRDSGYSQEYIDKRKAEEAAITNDDRTRAERAADEAAERAKQRAKADNLAATDGQKALAELNRNLQQLLSTIPGADGANANPELTNAIRELQNAEPDAFTIPEGVLRSVDKLKASSAGTFNPFAVRGFSGSTQERIAKATEDTAKHVKKLAQRSGRLLFAD